MCCEKDKHNCDCPEEKHHHPHTDNECCCHGTHSHDEEKHHHPHKRDKGKCHH